MLEFGTGICWGQGKWDFPGIGSDGVGNVASISVNLWVAACAVLAFWDVVIHKSIKKPTRTASATPHTAGAT
ncbi:hypothetical protein I547_3653 [Mycobacterium kansasii 824]|nr:hypothetical protein I547_3653 [Mycobacterium kansasii 824]